MPHRILIITNRIPYPLHDGGALAMHAMIAGYHQLGYEVSLLAMNTSRHYQSEHELPPLYREIDFISHDVDTDLRLIPVLKNFLLSKEPNHAARFFDRNFELKLRRIIDHFQPQIIQLESIFLATYLPVIRANSQAPIVIRLHNVEYQIWQRLADDRRIGLRRFYLRNLSERMRLFERQAWQQADLLLAISPEDAKQVVSDGIKTPVHVAPFGIQLQHSDKAPASLLQAYHLGAMDWLPNADGITWFMEDVWPSLHKHVPDFRFTFAGRNMPPSFMRLQQEGAICAGTVPDAQVFMADKGTLIIPLHSGSGIRVKALEAMALGKLVVSTTVGMQGIDAAVDKKHFLQADTVDEFVQAISFIRSHPNAATQIAQRGAALVREQYNQEAIMQGIHQAINGLLK